MRASGFSANQCRPVPDARSFPLYHQLSAQSELHWRPTEKRLISTMGYTISQKLIYFGSTLTAFAHESY
ncbi:hypothetical protein PSEUDO9AG_30169 [Pseudomonas sp. 9Ag]|nr:hypothetical protein PSEUDO9AG_30169 [Pseudomonas sp. 9Ag]